MAAIKLKTSLSAPECLARLRAVGTSSGWFFPPWSGLNEPMLVQVRGNRFRLMQAGGGPPRNSFRRMFYGQVLERSQGALIRGSFKMHPVVRLVLFIWYGGVIGVSLLLLAVNVGRALGMPIRGTAAGWPALAFPILMVVFTVVLVRSGVAFSNEGERIVVQYMGELLDASVEPSRV